MWGFVYFYTLYLTVPERAVRAEITHSSPPDFLFLRTLLEPQSDTHCTHCTANQYDSFQTSCATLTAFKYRKKTGNVLILYPPTLPPRLPSVPLPLTRISPAVSGASVHCIKRRRRAFVGVPGEALHWSANWFRWTSPNNGARQPGGGGGGHWTRTRTRRSTVASIARSP